LTSDRRSSGPPTKGSARHAPWRPSSACASPVWRRGSGGGLGKGGQVTLYVDGRKVGEGAIPMTQALLFSANDGCDVGEDNGAPVSPDYGARGNAFTGRVKGVQLAIAEAAERVDRLVSPEEAIRVALARQ
jgi:hypothetical protein